MHIHLLITLMLTPALAQAAGVESCHIEGRINGRLIKIKYADDNEGWNYKNKKLKHHKYCKLVHKEEDTPGLLNCTKSKGSMKTIVYELQTIYSEGGIATDQFYICKNGCKPGIAKKLFYVCESAG